MTHFVSLLSFTLAYALFPLCMATAAISDAATFTIPNRLCAVLICGFMLAAAVTGMPLHAIVTHVEVGAVALLLGFALFAFGFIGGGDGKLLAASALWFGWPDSGLYAIYFALAGGLVAFFLLFIRKTTLPPAFLATRDWVQRLYDPKMGVPYGVALAAGALLVYPNSELFARLTGHI